MSSYMFLFPNHVDEKYNAITKQFSSLLERAKIGLTHIIYGSSGIVQVRLDNEFQSVLDDMISKLSIDGAPVQCSVFIKNDDNTVAVITGPIVWEVEESRNSIHLTIHGPMLHNREMSEQSRDRILRIFKIREDFDALLASTSLNVEDNAKQINIE